MWLVYNNKTQFTRQMMSVFLLRCWRSFGWQLLKFSVLRTGVLIDGFSNDLSGILIFQAQLDHCGPLLETGKSPNRMQHFLAEKEERMVKRFLGLYVGIW